MNGLQALGLGALGGLFPDALRLIRLRHGLRAPAYLTKWWFWIGLALLVVMGAVASFLSHPASALAAISIGYGAPSIFSGVLGDREGHARNMGGGHGAKALAPKRDPIARVIGPLRRYWSA